MLSDEELLRYSRQILLKQVDIEGQLRLKQSRVLIVGLGGLGSPVALYLVAAGVGELHLADFDTLDLTNLQRQIVHDTPSLGLHKVDSAMARLEALNPHVRLVPHRSGLDADSLDAAIAEVDLVLDCTDPRGGQCGLRDGQETLGQWRGDSSRGAALGVRSPSRNEPLLPLPLRAR